MAWTRCYTHGLAPASRDTRRDEIASDLWEHADHDARHTGGVQIHTSLATIGRLGGGIPSDLAWRHRTRRATPNSSRGAPMAVNRTFRIATAIIAVQVVTLRALGGSAFSGSSTVPTSPIGTVSVSS